MKHILRKYSQWSIDYFVLSDCVKAESEPVKQVLLRLEQVHSHRGTHTLQKQLNNLIQTHDCATHKAQHAKQNNEQVLVQSPIVSSQEVIRPEGDDLHHSGDDDA